MKQGCRRCCSRSATTRYAALAHEADESRDPIPLPRSLVRIWHVQMAVPEPQDVEGGGAHNAGRAMSIHYGAAEGAHIRPPPTRAWTTFGAVALMCALISTARWTQTTQGPRELTARGRKTLAGHSLESIFPPPDQYSVKKMSFVKGESHMMNVSRADLCSTCYWLSLAGADHWPAIGEIVCSPACPDDFAKALPCILATRSRRI